MKSRSNVRCHKSIQKLPIFIGCFLLASCMVNDTIVLRFDDLYAYVSGRTAGSVAKEINERIEASRLAEEEKRYVDARNHLRMAIENIEKAFLLIGDDVGAWRSPIMFTPTKVNPESECGLDKDLVALYVRCYNKLIRYCIITGDIDGYYRGMRMICGLTHAAPEKDAFIGDSNSSLEFGQTCLFTLRAIGIYFAEGKIDESIKLNVILKQTMETVGTRSCAFWKTLAEPCGVTYKELYHAVNFMLATIYLRVGDLAKSGDVIKYLIGDCQRDELRIRSFVLLCHIKDSFHETRYASLYMKKAISLAVNKERPSYLIALLSALSPDIIEKYLPESSELVDSAYEVVLGREKLQVSTLWALIPGRNPDLNAAYIFRKLGHPDKMESCLSKFADNHTLNLNTIDDEISFMRILVSQGQWERIVDAYWPRIDEFEYHGEKTAGSSYAVASHETMSAVFSGLALAVKSLGERRNMLDLTPWPISLGAETCNGSEIAFRLIQLSKSRGILNAISESAGDRWLSSLRSSKEFETLQRTEIEVFRESLAGDPAQGPYLSRSDQLYPQWKKLRKVIGERQESAVVPYVHTVCARDLFVSSKEAAIEYSVIGEYILRCTVDYEEVQVDVLGISCGELNTLIKEFYNICVRRQSAGLERRASRLIAELIPPKLMGRENLKTIYIAPDRILGILPFDVVFRNGGVERFRELEIAYTPSLSVLESLRSSNGISKRESVALMGDPLPVEIGKAVSSTTQKCDAVSAALRGIVAQTKKHDQMGILADKAYSSSLDSLEAAFSRIPYTEVEIMQVDALFAKKGYERSVLLAQALTKSRVLEVLSQKPRYTHFATHAIITNEIPYIMEPSLIMSAGYKPMDHFLRASEIERLDLRGVDLVVLSACNTGIDLNYGSGGIAGIAKSFIIAGAKNVILALWSIEDKATSEFMTRLYSEILKGRSVREALSITKHGFTKSKNYRHPYFWGPFVIYGAS
jgi:CHAT domain-containing protein